MGRRHLAQKLFPVPLAAALLVAWLWPWPAWPALVAGLVVAAGVALLPLRPREVGALVNGDMPPERGGLLGLLVRRWGRLHRYHAALALLIYFWLAGLTLFFDQARAITAVFGGAAVLWGLLYSQRRGRLRAQRMRRARGS